MTIRARHGLSSARFSLVLGGRKLLRSNERDKMRAARAQFPPSSLERERGERPARKLAFRRRQVAGRISIGESQGQIVQTRIVPDHQDCVCLLGQSPNVFPQLALRDLVDPYFEYHLRRL